MALINKVDNTASIVYGGNTIKSNTVSTLLLLAPTVLKSVDKLNAAIGETLTYTVTITNPSLAEITNVAFSDAIASGAEYVAGSFKVNGTAATPTVTNSTISYTVASIASLATATIAFQAKVVGGSA